jgi:hypothetical protein
VDAEVGGGMRGGGIGTIVSSMGRPATAPGLQARAAALPHEQGRRRAADRRGWGTSRPDVSGRVREGERRARKHSGGAPTFGPGQHSTGRHSLNLA